MTLNELIENLEKLSAAIQDGLGHEVVWVSDGLGHRSIESIHLHPAGHVVLVLERQASYED